MVSAAAGGGIRAPAPASIVVQRRIEWADTDASGHYPYIAAFRLFEAAENALMQRLGLLRSTQGRLPRVHAEADFRRPLRSHDLVDIHARVAAVGASSITFAFEVRRDRELCVEGRVVGALLTRAEGERAVWTDEERRVLTSAGAQAAELLVEGGAPTPDPSPAGAGEGSLQSPMSFGMNVVLAEQMWRMSPGVPW